MEDFATMSIGSQIFTKPWKRGYLPLLLNFQCLRFSISVTDLVCIEDCLTIGVDIYAMWWTVFYYMFGLVYGVDLWMAIRWSVNGVCLVCYMVYISKWRCHLVNRECWIEFSLWTIDALLCQYVELVLNQNVEPLLHWTDECRYAIF